VLQTIALGCVPVVPNRLAYVELFDSQYRYAASDDIDIEGHNSAEKLVRVMAAGASDTPNVSRLCWRTMGLRYAALFAEVCKTLRLEPKP
jgi:hypothetical protein